MKKMVFHRTLVFLTLAVLVSAAAYSQNNNGQPWAKQPFEIRQSILSADGILDEYTESGWVVIKNKNDIFFEQLRYSAAGTLIEKTELYYDDTGVNIREKHVKDADDRLISRIVYQYRNGCLWQESVVEKTTGGINPVPISTNEYAYDSGGNRINRIVRGRGDIKYAETTYAYDARGNMVASETRDTADRVISSSRYTYNAQGNLTNQQVFNSEGKLITIINAVWQNGLELKNEMSAADGTVQLRVTNEYGRNGELLKKTIEKGESTRIVQYEYGLRTREQG